MVWVKIFQIRSSDKAIVFQFYNSKDDTEPFGSDKLVREAEKEEV